MSAPKWAVGMRRLMPGVYDDGKGGLHIEPSELLAAAGYADPEANRAMIERAVADLAAQEHIDHVYVEA